MRPITPFQITGFSILFTLILAVGIAGGWLLVGSLALGDFRGIAVIAAVVVCRYLTDLTVHQHKTKFQGVAKARLDHLAQHLVFRHLRFAIDLAGLRLQY